MPVISLSPSFLPKPALARVERRRRVAALGEPAHRLVRRVGVVGGDVEHEAGVERVPLPVQRVAGVLDERDQVLRQERDVVEAGVRRVALVEERQLAGVRRRVVLRQLEDAVQPPQQSFSTLVAFVSPVSSK